MINQRFMETSYVENIKIHRVVRLIIHFDINRKIHNKSDHERKIS